MWFLGSGIDRWVFIEPTERRLIIVHDTIWRFVNVDCEANTQMSDLRLESLINSTDRFEFAVHNCFQFCLSN
ncbi:MAG: hypothetical protein ACI84R_000872 [Candidatus Azotimanducaceae bacterium]|jgi:hypothetical protein